MLHARLRAAAGRDRIPTDGLVAWYTMDNISGSTLVDEMGNYDGTIVGATQAAGLIGQALSFDGNDYVDLSGTASGLSFIQNTHQFHISLWVKHDNIDNGQLDVILGSAIATAAKGFRFNFDDRGGSGYDKGLVFATYYGASGNSASQIVLNTGVSPTDGGWHFYEVWGDGADIYMALDLSQVGTGPVATNGSGDSSNNTQLGNISGTSFHLNGDEDDVFIYNRPLTSQERQILYDRGA